MRVLELFSGIGGLAAAVEGRAEVVQAVDQRERAIRVYRRNFAHPVTTVNLATVRPQRLVEADLWWMSPPCQPYTIRGQQRDLEDKRSAAFVRVVELIGQVRPRYVALENVPWFEGSQGHALLRQALAGYDVVERMLCPTELGVPNQRRRFYLVAGRDGLTDAGPPERVGGQLAAYLDPDAPDELDVEPDLAARFGDALHVVGPDADSAACFTSAYGRSPVYAGSYLRTGGRIRRFAPREILALLHFPRRFQLPEMDNRHLWPLVGNSLSVAAVREVLRVIPELSSRRDADLRRT